MVSVLYFCTSFTVSCGGRWNMGHLLYVLLTVLPVVTTLFLLCKRSKSWKCGFTGCTFITGFTLCSLPSFQDFSTNFSSTIWKGKKLTVLYRNFLDICRAHSHLSEVQSGICGKRTHDFFLTFSFTRQKIIQFTCHASTKTVTLRAFLHSEKTYVKVFQ